MPTEQPSSYSQFGEDRILEQLYREQATGVCVEVGANDGVTGSTTLLFERKGWQCLLVEPLPELAERIRATRSCMICECAASSEEGNAVLHVAQGANALSTLELTEQRRQVVSQEGGRLREIIVRRRTLDQILSQNDIASIDFITIDVEGHELDVLKGLSLAVYTPRIVILEDNSSQADRTIPHYMKERGYVNFKRTGVNDWYARESDQELFDPNEIQQLGRARRRARFKGLIIQTFAGISPHLPVGFKNWIKKVLDILGRTIR